MPINPNCQDKSNPKLNFLNVKISAPAKRALRNAGIVNLKQLSGFSEDELLQLHGLGKTTIPKLVEALKENNLELKK